MTLHVTYEHQCPKCAAYYIPYDEVVPCPQCGLIVKDRFDYIEQAAVSMRFNKREGSYIPSIPSAWLVGSLGDHILSLLFLIFDAYEDEAPDDFKDLHHYA